MAPVMPSMADVQGPFVLGFLVSFLFYGVLCTQMYIYQLNFPKDSKWIKGYVWSLFGLETFSAAIIMFDAYQRLAVTWGDFTTLDTPIWAFTALPPLGGFTAAFVHAFFCWRIYTLGRAAEKKIMVAIAAVVGAISVAQCFFAFYTGIKLSLSGTFATVATLETPILIWLAGTAICDVLIAATLITFLWSSRTGFLETDTKLKNLITITVETGFVTAALSIIEISLYVTDRSSNRHFGACLPLAKLYANVIMATLNARLITRRVGTVATESTLRSGRSSQQPMAKRMVFYKPGPLWQDQQKIQDQDIPLDLTGSTAHDASFDRAESPSLHKNVLL